MSVRNCHPIEGVSKEIYEKEKFVLVEIFSVSGKNVDVDLLGC
jgi:hypothetical protein